MVFDDSGERTSVLGGLIHTWMLIANALERARSASPEAIVAAIKATSHTGGLMPYDGPIVFNEIGDNSRAISTVIQTLGQKPVPVSPREAPVEKFVFPRPRG